MTDTDLKMMIARVIGEIEQLRAQVAALQPRAEAYATITQILGLLPRQSQGMGEDIVWKLKRELEEIQRRPQPVTAPPRQTEEDGA